MGYEAVAGSFTITGGGLFTAAPQTPQNLQPNGAVMYQGTSDPNCTASFTGTTEADIIIGNGAVAAQACYDTFERALITLAGMQWLASGDSATAISTLFSGYYLYMTHGIRLMALNASSPNAAVDAFVISTDGTPVNGANGPVAFLSSSQLTEAQVQAAVQGLGLLSLAQFMALK